VARAKFLPQCEAVTASAAYCQCLYEKLPAGYTWFADEPWLLFVMSIKERKYLGAMSQGEDTDEARTNLFFTARRAVQECASSR
jgi:hypothetical protein